MRILIAEDEAQLARGLVQALKEAGHAADWVPEGRAADAALRSNEFDLLILDLALPEMDGFEVLKRLRSRRTKTMVLILSAEDEIDARIRGLDLGADDYLTKPFALGELEARIRALSRRGSLAGEVAVRCGGLVLDRAGQTVSHEGVALELTRAEFIVLAALMERCGKVVPKAQLFNQMYDWEAEAGLSAVEVYVSRIRKKIERAGARIRAVRGLGYLLEAGPRGPGSDDS